MPFWRPAARSPFADVPRQQRHRAACVLNLDVTEVREILYSRYVAVAVRHRGDALHRIRQGCRRHIINRAVDRWKIDLRRTDASLFTHRAEIFGRPLSRRRAPERAERVVKERELV